MKALALTEDRDVCWTCLITLGFKQEEIRCPAVTTRAEVRLAKACFAWRAAREAFSLLVVGIVLIWADIQASVAKEVSARCALGALL